MIVAGCNAITGGNGDDQELYEQGNEDKLLPETVGDDWPDPNLERADEANEFIDRIFMSPDSSGSSIRLLIDVQIAVTIDKAEDEMESEKATAGAFDDYPLADEAIVYEAAENARTVFRETNAVGIVAAKRQSGLEPIPDRQRAIDYADLIYNNYW